MKLVVVWNDSDGYTYSCEVVQCVEYSSAEQFLVDYDAHKKTNPPAPFYSGEGFAGTDLGYEDNIGLEIYELEEWFDKHKAQPKVNNEQPN